MINSGGSSTSTDSSKIYKIKYQINILPGIGVHHRGSDVLLNKDIDWMNILQNSQEIDMFKSKSILPFIKFKWEMYGQ